MDDRVIGILIAHYDELNTNGSCTLFSLIHITLKPLCVI